MTTIDTFESMSSGSRSQPASSYTLPTIVVWFEALFERRRSRLALMEMSDEQLKDIGVSRAEAYGEANRPFWD